MQNRSLGNYQLKKKGKRTKKFASSQKIYSFLNHKNNLHQNR